MIKIMLACSAGMSTSILVGKMRETAEKHGIKAEIWAIPESELSSKIDTCDVLLLGPQVRFILPRAEELAKPLGIPVEVIDMKYYGVCNGAAVLKQALNMYKSNKKG